MYNRFARMRQQYLREHRGLSVERRIKAVFWWCYQHSPKPLSSSEILKIMPTDQSIAEIYQHLNRKYREDTNIPGWGDGIAWSELHSVGETFGISHQHVLSYNPVRSRRKPAPYITPFASVLLLGL